ncbi:MAG: hypothetical protein J6U01_09590 [Clostridia bacterium]|nr:hypothetical protein [Clostridia bacterium]
MNGVGTKRHPVTQEDCDIARFFTRRGMKLKEIAKMLNVDSSTVSKMKAGDFRLEQYLEIRKESNRKSAEKKAAETVQLAGQMEMNLKPETETPEMSEQTKMMRFQAHLADRIIKKLDEILTELRRMQNGGVDDEQG